MIVISGALVLVALVLLVLGVTMQMIDFVYASIGVSLVSLIFLVIGILQRRRGGSAPKAAPARATVTQAPAMEPYSSAPAAAQGARREPAPLPSKPVRGIPVKAGATGKLPVQASAVALLDDDDDYDDEEGGGVVLVVVGRPRYHIDGCRYLAGKPAEELDVLDAREEGFSPCGVCRPDDALAAAVVGRPADSTDDAFAEQDVEDEPAVVQLPPAAKAARAAPVTSRRAGTTRRVSEESGSADADTAAFATATTGRPPVLQSGVTKPTASKPGAVKPGAVKPGAVKPGAVKPGAVKPGASKPGASRPAPVKADSFRKPAPGVSSPSMSGAGTSKLVPGKGAAVPAKAGAGKTAVGKPIPGKTAVGKPIPDRTAAASRTAAAAPTTRPPAKAPSRTEAVAPAPTSAPTRPARTTAPVKAAGPVKFAAGKSVRSFPGAPPTRTGTRGAAQTGPDAKIASALVGTAKPGASKPAPVKADSFLAAAPGISSKPAKAPESKSARAASSGAAESAAVVTPKSARSTAATAQKLTSKTTSVVVIPDRNRYHRNDCRFVRGVEDAQSLSKVQATKQGYAPCGVCKP